MTDPKDDRNEGITSFDLVDQLPAAQELEQVADGKTLTDAAETLQRAHGILSLDNLLAMTEVDVHFEAEFPQLNAYFFSIEGRIEGFPVRGLLAGNCMLIRAKNRKVAFQIARAGLSDTIIFAQQYGAAQELGVDLNDSPQNEGVSIDAYHKARH